VYDILKFTPLSPEIEKAEEDFINPLLEKFVMNVTALNNYLRCPIEFYYKSLVRIPTGKSEATEFGSAVHYALEKFFRKMSASALENKDASFGTADELVENFNWYIHRHRQHFTREAFARKLEYGNEVLRNYYQTYINRWNKIVITERNFRAMVGEVPIKGKIDKLEFNGKEVNVVDYKSGSFENALDKMKGPNDKNPMGGDYWRQAVFYKILIDNHTAKDWKVVSTEFDFIEPDKKKLYQKVKIYILPADVETVKQQLREVWDKIQAKNFYTGCGKEDCHWCTFIRDNKLAVALHEHEEEEEES
ncbi:MAG TPA: PD-(D/E)XK nuclease family protein, partial [Ferruginibacter sp.]|nr:PD-(D/E)XK nuclease family protein [Ferruginibacter sp.]